VERLVERLVGRLVTKGVGGLVRGRRRGRGGRPCRRRPERRQNSGTKLADFLAVPPTHHRASSRTWSLFIFLSPRAAASRLRRRNR
jgi:hypothetical protein